MYNRFPAYRASRLQSPGDLANECRPEVQNLVRQAKQCSDSARQAGACNAYVNLMMEKFGEHLEFAFNVRPQHLLSDERQILLNKVRQSRSTLWNRMCDKYNGSSYDPRFCPTAALHLYLLMNALWGDAWNNPSS